MVKLRRDLLKLVTLLQMMKNREDKKSEIMENEFSILKQRLEMKDYNNDVQKKVEKEKLAEIRQNALQV